MTADVQQAVLHRLSGGGALRFGCPYLVGTIHKEVGRSETQVWEALWGLAGEGLVCLDTNGQESGTDNRERCLPADGRRVAPGGSWGPRDLDGYLNRIHREIPDLVVAQSYTSSAMASAPAMAKELAKPRTDYFALWTEFRKRIEPVRQDLRDGLADVLALDAIEDLIRMTRSEVGHPAGRQIDEDTAQAHLAIALIYLCKMKQLANHFAAETGGVKA